MEKELVIIDTDPGLDDAIAIALAVHPLSKNYEIIFVSSYGNGPLRVTQKNLCNLLSLVDNEYFVVIGSDAPINGSEPEYDYYHGSDCLGGLSDYLSRLSNGDDAKVTLIHNINTMIEYCSKFEQVTYITLGPLTNLSKLIKHYPSFVTKIKNVLVMGGALLFSNAPHKSEYNFACDPESVSFVFESGLPIKLFPFDLSINYPVSEHEIKSLELTGANMLFIKILNALLLSANMHGRAKVDIPDVFPVLFHFIDSTPFVFTKIPLSVDKWGALFLSGSGTMIDVAIGLSDSRLLYNCLQKYIG